jgi:uncharacterized membrane protein
MFAAIIALATMFLKVDIPSVNGYINIGDSMIFLCAILLGRRAGFFAGGIGSALADLLLGYAQYAPFTFVVKGIEGLIVGTIAYRKEEKDGFKREAVAVTVGALWMMFGYFIVYIILYGVKAAIAASMGDIFQVIGSIAIGLPIIYALKKSKFMDKLGIVYQHK